MLSDLPWMTDDSRIGAYDKITNLQVNIAYPDFVVNDTALDLYYSNLAFDANDDFFSMIKKLQQFNQFLTLNYLSQTMLDRTDFLGPPGIVNAWYQVGEQC